MKKTVQFSSIFIVLLGFYLLYFNRPQEEISEIETPIETQSVNCKIIEMYENYSGEMYAFTILTEKCGPFYISQDKSEEFKKSGILKSLTKNSKSTIIFSKQENRPEKFVEKIVHNDNVYMKETTILTYEKRMVEPSGMKKYGPYITILFGIFFFFLGKSSRRNELSEIENLKLNPANSNLDLSSTINVKIGFRLTKLKDYFVVDRMDNGIDYSQIFKIHSDKFSYKRTLKQKSINLSSIDYLSLILSYSPRENELTAEFLVKNKSSKNFETVYFYKIVKPQFDKDYPEFFISQNTELLENLSGILGKGFKVLNNIK